MVCVWGVGVVPPAQIQSCDRTWPYLIKGRRSLPNNWAIKDYFQPHNRGAVEEGGDRGGKRGCLWREEVNWKKPADGNHLSGCSLILKKRERKKGGGKGGVKKEQASSSSLQKNTHKSIYLSNYVLDVHVWCFLLAFFWAIKREKQNKRACRGPGMQHTRLSPGAVKRETRVWSFICGGDFYVRQVLIFIILVCCCHFHISLAINYSLLIISWIAVSTFGDQI